MLAQQCDQDLLTQLRIISSIRPQDCISTNNNTKPNIRIQKPGVSRSWWRFWASENRTTNTLYIQALLQRVIERYNEALTKNDSILIRRLQTETTGAIKGLEQLQITYEEDAQFQAALNVAIETITLTLELNEHALNDDDKTEHEL